MCFEGRTELSDTTMPSIGFQGMAVTTACLDSLKRGEFSSLEHVNRSTLKEQMLFLMCFTLECGNIYDAYTIHVLNVMHVDMFTYIVSHIYAR